MHSQLPNSATILKTSPTQNLTITTEYSVLMTYVPSMLETTIKLKDSHCVRPPECACAYALYNLSDSTETTLRLITRRAPNSKSYACLYLIIHVPNPLLPKQIAQMR
jgi:hypothetical protein